MSRPGWRKGISSSTPDDEKPFTTSTDIVTSSSSRPTVISGMSMSPYESTGGVFFDVVIEFVNASNDVWPQDELISTEKVRLEKFDSIDKKQIEGIKLAKQFHLLFHTNYTKIIAKDSNFFSQDELKVLQTVFKYNNSPNEVQDTVWEYLRSLVQYAGMIDMYSKCPQGMLDSISGVAGGLIAKMQSGELDSNSLNPMELGQILMQQMSMSDLESFGSAIMENGNIDSMMSMMQTTMSSMNTSGGIPGMPKGMDLGGLMSMMGSMNK